MVSYVVQCSYLTHIAITQIDTSRYKRRFILVTFRELCRLMTCVITMESIHYHRILRDKKNKTIISSPCYVTVVSNIAHEPVKHRRVTLQLVELHQSKF